jgi:hypothetical protein
MIGHMKPLLCSASRPWGIHPSLFSDSECPRCGWTAPGPLGDARLDAKEGAETASAAASGALTGGEALAA